MACFESISPRNFRSGHLRRRALSAAALAPCLIAASPPVFIKNSMNLNYGYPQRALVNEEQGVTRVVIKVEANGRPVACTVAKSSGSNRLDEQSCKSFLERARFEPARDDAGLAVPGVYRGPVIFELRPLNDRISKDATYVGYSVSVSFDKAGNVDKCGVAPLLPNISLTPNQFNKCDQLGSRDVFGKFLKRSTVGFVSASLRIYTVDWRARIRLSTKGSLYQELARVDFDRLSDGGISWCEVTIPPTDPALGLKAEDLCGATAFGANRPPVGGFMNSFIVDVVAQASR